MRSAALDDGSVAVQRLAIEATCLGFFPFGLLVDQWRWKVYGGEVTPANYDRAWWDLTLKYQGTVPPGARSESDFDLGASHHVAGNTPSARPFLAAIQQVPCDCAMCKEAGHTGPLFTCSFCGCKEAAQRWRRC